VYGPYQDPEVVSVVENDETVFPPAHEAATHNNASAVGDTLGETIVVIFDVFTA
jgi:hypothetical protein